MKSELFKVNNMKERKTEYNLASVIDLTLFPHFYKYGKPKEMDTVKGYAYEMTTQLKLHL